MRDREREREHENDNSFNMTTSWDWVTGSWCWNLALKRFYKQKSCLSRDLGRPSQRASWHTTRSTSMRHPRRRSRTGLWRCSVRSFSADCLSWAFFRGHPHGLWSFIDCGWSSALWAQEVRRLEGKLWETYCRTSRSTCSRAGANTCAYLPVGSKKMMS